MGYKKTFATDTDITTIQKRTLKFFVLAGYVQNLTAEAALEFEKGNRACKWSKEPGKCYVKVKIKIEKMKDNRTSISVDYDIGKINNDGYVEIYVLEEIKNLKTYLSRNEYRPVIIDGYRNKRIAAQVLAGFRSFGIALGWLIIIYAIIALFGIYTYDSLFKKDLSLTMLSGMIIAVAVITGFSFIWRKYRKNKAENLDL